MPDMGQMISAGITGLVSRRQMKREYRYNVAHAQRAMDFEAAQAQKQMDFQKDMSSTAIQRAAADAEAAGLNRILALGQPSATTAGAMARGHKASQSGGPDVAANMTRAASALGTIREQEARTKLLKEEQRKTKAEADKAEITRLPYSYLQDVLGGESSSAKDAVVKTKSLKQNIENIWEDTKAKTKFLNEHYKRKARNLNSGGNSKAKGTTIHITKPQGE